MRVLIISGTSHKGSTYSIGRILAEKLTDSADISEIFLPADFGEFCCGCANCFVKTEEKCPHYSRLSLTTMAGAGWYTDLRKKCSQSRR